MLIHYLYINEGCSLNDTKIKRMIKWYYNYCYEIDEGFIGYFDKFILAKELKQKIL